MHIKPGKASNAYSQLIEDRLQNGLNIERPRSALHSGDFTTSQADQQRQLGRDDELASGPQLVSDPPWIATSPPRNFNPFRSDHRNAFRQLDGDFQSVPRSPLSSSASLGFAYFPPTSPLVQSESNDEIDFTPENPKLGLPIQEFSQRLRSLSHNSSTLFSSPGPRPPVRSARSSLGSRREPYQAHQPRRSLSSAVSAPLPEHSPQMPASVGARRPSLGSDSSPIQHASMVGSYEESILRGRMSTSPSKPFNFQAQIGVLGKGKCKSSLRCPAHVTLPFSAVYYNYSSTLYSRSRSNDGPSPYVGQIDLENGLSTSKDDDQSRGERGRRGRYMHRPGEEDGPDITMIDFDDANSSRTSSRTGPPRAPPGGSYRIPEKGQVQIVIKNSNKTAVKLFLVPYDLTGMEPGTKTFVRQRSYSAGPIVDNVPNASETDAQSRPMLRYLVHLHICCPSRGRFCLYKSIRVVFANRVPEGKEKLRNETTWPEPRFTPYKPVRVMHPPLTMSASSGASLTADKAFRRRSLGVSFIRGTSSHAMDMLDGLDHSGGGRALPIAPIPFHLPPRDPRAASDSSGSDSNVTSLSRSGAIAATAAGMNPPAPSPSPASKGAFSLDWASTFPSPYEKLNRGDVGYGGHTFPSPSCGDGVGGVSPETEGLLSQHLRSMGMNQPPRPPSPDDEEAMHIDHAP